MFDYAKDYSSLSINGKICKPTIQELVANDFDNQGLKYSQDGKRLLMCKRTKNEVLYIKQGVEIICDKAFGGIKSIKKVHLPNSLCIIGDSAFEKCTNLDSISISPNIIFIGKNAFGSTSLTQLDLSDTQLTYINERAFVNCKKLNSIVLPNSLKAILSGGFGNVSIKEIHLPDNVEYLGYSAIVSSNLLRINLPASLNLFFNSSIIGNKKMEVNSSNSKFIFDNGFYYFNDKTNLFRCSNSHFPFLDYKDIIIPQNVKTISSYCFSGLGNIKFSLDSKIETIGEYAFAFSGFTSDFIPDSLTRIESHAFYNSSIEKLYLTNNLEYIGDKAFSNCKYLKFIYIPDSIKIIGNDIFENCTNLEEICVSPESVDRLKSLIPEYRRIITSREPTKKEQEILKYHEFAKKCLHKNGVIFLELDTCSDIEKKESKLKLTNIQYKAIDYKTFEIRATIKGEINHLETISISIALYDKNNIIRSASLLCCLVSNDLHKRSFVAHKEINSRIPLYDISKIRFFYGFHCLKT